MAYNEIALAAVVVNGKYGFIDIHGNFIVAPQFDYTFRFMHGVGTGFIFEDPERSIKAKSTYLDKAGNVLKANKK